MEVRGARSRHRKFYELPPEGEANGLQSNGEEAKAERDTLTKYINSSVIGKNATFLRWHLGLSDNSLQSQNAPSTAPLEGKLSCTATTLPLAAVLSS